MIAARHGARAAAEQTSAIQFARGATAATVKGSITGDQSRDDRVNARRGQTLSVSLANPDGRAFFNVLPPGSSDEANFVGSRDGNGFRGPVTADGDTTTRVYQMRATGRRGEVATYALSVGVTGRPAAGSSDAKVPGTDFHATAQIRCVAEPDKPMTMCAAGVKRAGQGNATVHISTPDGGSRIIAFRSGRAVSSDSEAGIRVERRGDTSVLRIGTVEVYEIPDALVFGG